MAVKNRAKEQRDRLVHQSRLLGESTLVSQIVNFMAECALACNKPVSTLPWGEFKNWLKFIKQIDPDELKSIAASISAKGGYQVIRDAFFPPYTSAEAIEKTAIRQEAGRNRKQITEEAKEQVFLAYFEGMLSRVLPKMKFPDRPYVTAKGKEVKTSRILNLFFSDLHIGARLTAKEHLVDYGSLSTSRRLAYIVKMACDYKRDHRDETILHLYLGGDILNGKLDHGGQKSEGEVLADQWDEALYLLLASIQVLASNFKQVEVFCTSGNHDRIKDVHAGRATSEKYNSYAMMLYRALKRAAENKLSNVQVHTPKTAWVSVPIFKNRLYLTHGDTNLNPGNPGSSIDVKRLTQQMNAINIGEVQYGRKPYGAFLVGHVHIGANIKIPGGYRLIANPALLPKDSYGLGYGHGQSCGQSLFESTEQFIVGDCRTIDVDEKVDKMASLDEIICPYEGF